ncbi:MAG: ATP-dependent helicase/nuclease subunit A [Crocinitomicaceae bacterium]|jgi:ATP-dependent helicase/nuclease subunit A
MHSSLLIEASAGSGKTYQLSNRFLALLSLGENPADLIALTFTRKAAGEFTRRILNRLALGASTEKEAAILAAALTPTLIGDAYSEQPGIVQPAQLPDLSMQRFRELLAILVSSLDQLQLSTLDSFFTRLVSSFGPELGLAGFEMLDEDRYALAREETLQQVLNGGSLDKRQRDLFLSAFAIANYGNEEARVRDSILEFVKDHHERLLQCPSPASWGNADAIWDDHENWPKYSLAKVVALQQEILIATPETLGHGTLNKTFLKFTNSITDYIPGTPLPDSVKKNLFKWVDSIPSGSDEIHFHYNRADRVFPVRLTALLVELEELIRCTEIGIFLKRTQGIWAVVSAFEHQYNKQCRSQGRVSFADLTLLLQQHAVLARKTGFNELAYRLDSQFRHWMLDEFQDTSRRQWDVIEPVINEAVIDHEGERSLFVVGDTKQSIYGWRGGEPRLFSEIAERPEWERLQEWTMAHSWRSSKTVLDFVNLICAPDGEGMSPLPDETRLRWTFQEHLAAKGLAGEIKIFQFSDKNEEGYSDKEAAIISELKRIDPIHRDLSCALLVSSNKQVQHYTSLLREQTKFPIEAEAAVSISSDSPLGLTLLDWFKFLVFPADNFSRRHIETSPLSSSVEQYGESEATQYSSARSEISAHGVSYHISKLVSRLPDTLEIGSFQQMRLEQILNTARAFDTIGGTLEEWLRMLENQTHREESGQGAIQIMTVHKSKGLEFDIVMLPELDGSSYDTVTRMGMLTKDNEQHIPEHFLNKPVKEIIVRDPQLSEQYNQWVADNCYERACNLYVALTRAAHSIYLFLKEPAKKANPTSSLNDAGWVHRSIGDREASVVTLENEISGQLLYQSGCQEWLAEFPLVETVESDERQQLSLPQASPRVGRRTASKDKSKFFIKRNSRASQSGKQFGNNVHDLFESIVTIKDSKILPENEYADVVRKALALPESQHWFGDHSNSEILREQAIEAIDDNGTWFSGVIDRAIVHFDANQTATKIEILDFKTDSVSSAEELVERYSGQLQSYAKVLSSVYQLPISEISTCLLSTKLNTYISI